MNSEDKVEANILERNHYISNLHGNLRALCVISKSDSKDKFIYATGDN